ncbi:head, terminase DNA packaging protein A [Xanthomonas phage FoX4]|uniref:Terminase, large subunit n=1 Tax=Xanthomonas phage FoX4 TaxID=2723900 RepID=A0A858WJU1_9CAUD|nr:terminase large subunit [Xanthomonas phage FoX4]QJI52970.1 head, terminase DNA packaging protein A [Xanthomonas phage FoX4]
MELAALLKPAEHISVSDAATQYRKLNNPGAYIGDWDNALVPYMIEPMNELNSPEFEGEAFVGGAQSSKTDSLLLNWLTHTVICDPMDMTIYSPSTAAARDFAERRIGRLHRDSPMVGKALRGDRNADNKMDKQYASGMMLTLSWPSPIEFAGKPIPKVGITDYDRIDDDIEGDGNAYDLASKRTTTFGSYAMTLAESSPSKPITDPKWIPKTPHEAPPATGIFALYNRGDRRRYYWKCPSCAKRFEALFEHLQWDEKENEAEASATVRMVCPLCQHHISPDEKFDLNLEGRWLKEGQYFDENDQPAGPARRSKIASFWLRGVAAAFMKWRQLVENYLIAKKEYENTGDEGGLQKFFNNDLAEVYIPKSLFSDRLPEVLKSRSEPLPEKMVPPEVRFLQATVDVQKNMFIVQVFGVCPGRPFDLLVIDRFRIMYSKREDPNAPGQMQWVKPSSYVEDWELLVDEVMDKAYPLQEDPSRQMRIKLTVCDSGGYSKGKGESVTDKAYDFYRLLRERNQHGRFHLLKGDPSPNAPLTRITYPLAQKKDKLQVARGDVPVLLINTNQMKDALSGRLDCVEPGKGMLRFPDWLPNWFYSELCAEVRTPKGWENPSHTRNEATDLTCYAMAGCMSELLGVHHLDWNNPPRWAATHDRNDMITSTDLPLAFDEVKSQSYSFADFGRQLAG